MGIRDVRVGFTQLRGLREGGLSFLEVLVSLAVISIALTSLAGFLVQVVRSHQLALRHWGETLETWNRVQELRSSLVFDELQGLSSEEEGLVRVTLEGTTGEPWEVVCGR